MGVLLTEIVHATRPGHEGPGHEITVKHRAGEQRFMPYWTCSCGALGTITDADVRTALQSGAVTAT